MQLNTLVNRTNAYLAGETLTLTQLAIHFDFVIREINIRLNAEYPTVSEFIDNHGSFSNYPDYNFFPERFIDQVIPIGAAYYFYLNDEEGADSAIKYGELYARHLFYFARDFIDLVPDAYRAGYEGSLSTPATYGIPAFYDDIF